MNILLNNYCNLKCDYCFANKVLEEDKKGLSLKDFRWLLEFLKNSKDGNIRLIGGEPTLHPNFTDFILESSQRDFINSIHVFTNGTYPYRYNELFNLVSNRKRVSLLVNFNEKESVGEKKYKQTLVNLDRLLSLIHI